MEQVPAALLRIAKALEGINEKLELLTERTGQPAPETSIEPEHNAQTTMRDDPIAKVISEVGRIDEEELAERRKQNPKAQKLGYAMRFYNGCRQSKIETVGDLLDFGYRGLLRGWMRYAGKSLADRVTKALTNLYGITEW